MDEVFEGEIVERVSPDAATAIQPQRDALIERCIQLHGTHDWRLHLHPDTPDLVEVYCGNCPASLEDVWEGATVLLYLQLPDYIVAEGTHTAKAVVDQPINVFIRESMSINRQLMRLGSEMEVQVGLRNGAALPSAEGRGTGWCAPSP
jgi:hypothetical protein